jgi:hypothetical protein
MSLYYMYKNRGFIKVKKHKNNTKKTIQPINKAIRNRWLKKLFSKI